MRGSVAYEDVQQFDAMILGVCKKFFPVMQDAEDAAQEARLKAWAKLEQYRGESKLSTWLYRVAFTTCLEIKRKKRSGYRIQNEASLEACREEFNFDAPDESITPADERIYHAELIERFKKRAPEAFSIIHSKYVEGLEAKEMSRRANCQLGTMKSKILRSRAVLQRLCPTPA